MEATVESESTETSNQTQTHADDELTSLKTALAEKEYAMQNLISTHDKLKTTLRAEIAKLESEKSNLLATLDEANLIREEKEGTLTVCREEIQRLRSLLAESQNKYKQTEESARSATETKFRENLLVQFEEERNKVGDQLKWKSEQFAHLEEAHVKLQSELREVKREKEAEQLEFLGKIGGLELALDEKTRLAEDLRSRLEICNQVLAREESKRKLVEAELRESRDQYDSLVIDFEAAKLAVESVTEKRDEEVASLRGILSDKSLQIKEIEFEKAQIDLENKELRASLKEYREIEIGGVEKSKKFRALEKAHKVCSEKIKKREAEIENLKRDLDDRIVRLQEKEELVEKLQSELLQIRNEESVMDDLNGDAVTILRKREEALREERDMLLCERKEKIDLLERVKECMDREKVVVTENDRLICEVREKEGMIKQLTEERARLLEKENARLYHEDEERKQMMKEVEMCKDKLDTLVKEREMLLLELGEKNNLVKRVKECVDREKGLVTENDRLICEVREMEGMIRQLKMEIAQLLEKENARQCIEDEEKKQFMKEVQLYKDRLDALVKEREMLLLELGEKNNLVERVKECMDREKGLLGENDRLICEVKEREGVTRQLKMEIAQLLEKENARQCIEDEEKKQFMKEVQLYKDRLDALVKEREMLLLELGEKNNLVERVKECMDREKGLLGENDRLICEVKEREGVTKQLKMEIAQLLEKENVRQCIEDEEKKQLMKEVQMYKNRLDALVKEKELLLFEVRQKEDIEQQLRECRDREEALLREKEKFICDLRERQGIIEGNEQQLRECRDREEALLREKEKFICDLRERQGLIEELERNIACSKEHISRLELEICSLEEEKRKFVEIRDEMAKKLLEIKFKLDPLEKKCSEVVKEKKSETSVLELNLELLVEELENSICEKEDLQLGLQEMVTSYFLQKHELEFREGLYCDLEEEMKKIKNNMRIKEEKFEEELERERLVNEVKRVRFSNDINSLMRERETLALQMHDLNCGIGSLLCADGEIKAIIGGILQHMENEGEHMHEKKSKPLVPLFGTRSPLKENNFY